MTAWKTATHEVTYKSLGKRNDVKYFWTCSCGTSSNKGYHTEREAQRYGTQHRRHPVR